jgi:crotonobetaine/carnitine-CoA ligase
MLDLGPDDVSYFFLPFFHVDAHCVLPACLLSGAVFGFGRRFSVSRFWDECAALGATWFIAVGSMVSALVARRPDELPEHSLRIACAAPISEEVYPFFENELGIPLLQLYGQTEADCVVFTTPQRNPHGAAGWACAGFDIAVVDEHDRVLGAGDVGRLIYRPRMPNQLTMGYWRRPEATVQASKNLWWHTGDLARLDEEGTMYFAGRASDSLRHRGENISAYELENALSEAPGVRRAIAVAVADDLGTEDEIKIFVVLDDEAAWDPLVFFAFCDETLPRYASPRFVEPIDESQLVLSPGNGSVHKHLLSRDHGPRVSDRELLAAPKPSSR